MTELRNIKKTYGERTVLDIESLSLFKGQITVIVGPNGSGKSTLLKILAGVLENDGEKIILDGSVRYLPQNSLPFSKSVKNNISYSYTGDKKERQRCCDDIIERLALTPFKNKNAKSLSGGECQRLALGRVLINGCEYLLLDEPSSAADIEGNDIIEAAIEDYRKKHGCCVIMTTHSPAQAKRLADRIIMLHEGRIIEDGTAAELLENPSSEWGKRFMQLWKIEN